MKSYNIPLKKENNQRCTHERPNECSLCASNYMLTSLGQCILKLVKPSPTPGLEDVPYQFNHSLAVNGTYPLNIKEEEVNSTQRLVVNLPSEDNSGNEYNIITIENPFKKNIAINLEERVINSELTINSNSNEQFDIIPPNVPIQIYLGQRTTASFKDAQGEITIVSSGQNNNVKLNQVEPKNSFTLIPKNSRTSITIEKIDFTVHDNNDESTQYVIIKSKDNKQVKITDVTVQQTLSGEIRNATITGTIKFGFESNLKINEFVDISESTLDISYNISQAQGIDSDAPINGYISKCPKSINLNDRVVGTLLANERFLIAESYINFASCDEWKQATYINSVNTFLSEKGDGKKCKL